MAGNTLVYNSTNHEVRQHFVNGNKVIWVNIPGKGWISIDPVTGAGYTYDDQSGQAVKRTLTNYDKLFLQKLRVFTNTPFNGRPLSNNLQKYQRNFGGNVSHLSNGAAYLLFGNSRLFDNGIIITNDGRRVQVDWNKSMGNQNFGSTKTSTGDTLVTSSNQTTDTNLTDQTSETKGTGLTRGTGGTNPMTRAEAWRRARNRGLGVFSWRGKLYTTRAAGENEEEFRKNHADYRAIYEKYHPTTATPATTTSTPATTTSTPATTTSTPATTTSTPATTTSTPATTTTPLLLPKQYPILALFNKKDIRKMGFRNYSGMLAAINDLRNASNPFVIAMRNRYGADTSKWNLQQIERDLNISGNYRGWWRGDFGDMTRSMNSYIDTNNRNNNDLLKLIAKAYYNHNPLQLNTAFTSSTTSTSTTPSTSTTTPPTTPSATTSTIPFNPTSYTTSYQEYLNAHPDGDYTSYSRYIQ